MNKKELFIVEGQSAGHALDFAIDNKTQSVFALQGKLANVRKTSHDVIADNRECQKLMAKLGGVFASDYEIDQLPYSQVLVLMDPDIDGAHSSALVLSFFARYCKPIVAAGLLSIIKPPMFRVTSSARETVYAWTEGELQAVLNDSEQNQTLQTTRFKGVAQFSAEECHTLLLNRATRRQYILRDEVP